MSDDCHHVSACDIAPHLMINDALHINFELSAIDFFSFVFNLNELAESVLSFLEIIQSCSNEKWSET